MLLYKGSACLALYHGAIGWYVFACSYCYITGLHYAIRIALLLSVLICIILGLYHLSKTQIIMVNI